MELHVEWINDCIEWMRDNNKKVIEATKVVEEEWMDFVNEVADQTVYKSCNSWYNASNIEEKANDFLPFIGVPPYTEKINEVAEQMGVVLKNTSYSVNIKERLDFSCAIFGGDGGLVANAPHVPVHLGAMADTVRAQVEKTRAFLAAGDVIVANDPNSGGSHLPDITVITPVFPEGAVRGDGAAFDGAGPGAAADKGAALRRAAYVAVDEGPQAAVGHLGDLLADCGLKAGERARLKRERAKLRPVL